MKQMFYGGVHPAEHKEATEQKPIQPLANAPAQVVIPMSMHIGAPCKPVVQKGDTVTVAKRLARPQALAPPSTPVFLALWWQWSPVLEPAARLRFLS